jgi:hypothetical protein
VAISSDILLAPEADLVEWLFSQSAARIAVREELNLPSAAQPHYRVSTTTLTSGKIGPGDVDVLFVDNDHPAYSTALECKRLKVDAHSFITNEPGKLKELRKGVRQANGLLKLGFARSFLALLVTVDGRERPEGPQWFSKLTDELLRTVYDFPGKDRLHDGVGLLVCEITQPTDKPVDLAGAIGVKVTQPAAERAQLELVTRFVSRLGR